MGTSSERVFNGSGKGYLPAGTMGNRTHILSERLKAGTEFKRLKKGHRPAPMPPTWTHILSYKPILILIKARPQKRTTARHKEPSVLKTRVTVSGFYKPSLTTESLEGLQHKSKCERERKDYKGANCRIPNNAMRNIDVQSPNKHHMDSVNIKTKGR